MPSTSFIVLIVDALGTVASAVGLQGHTPAVKGTIRLDLSVGRKLATNANNRNLTGRTLKLTAAFNSILYVYVCADPATDVRPESQNTVMGSGTSCKKVN